jgi:hypothetical protein
MFSHFECSVVLVRQSHLPILAAALTVSTSVDSLALPAGADRGSINDLLPSGQTHTDNSLMISAQSASKITMKVHCVLMVFDWSAFILHVFLLVRSGPGRVSSGDARAERRT